jgi:hypothetical protein
MTAVQNTRAKTAEMAEESMKTLKTGGYCFSSLLLLSEQDAERVHPDDLPAVRRKYPHGWSLLCFRYGGRQHEYDVLDDGELQMWVKNAVIRPIPTPKFNRNERVFAHPNSAVGIVREVIWHLKRECVYYVLEFNGRRSGRWYFESDLAELKNVQQAPPGDRLRK